MSTLRLHGLGPSNTVLAGERDSGGSSALDGASGGVHCSSKCCWSMVAGNGTQERSKDGRMRERGKKQWRF